MGLVADQAAVALSGFDDKPGSPSVGRDTRGTRIAQTALFGKADDGPAGQQTRPQAGGFQLR